MKEILAAIDDSGIATSVVSEASALAEATGAKVVLLRVVPNSLEPATPNIFERAGDTRVLIAAAEADLSSRQAEIPQAHRGEVVVEVGDPWKTVCRVARDRHVDLVLIGAHQYRLPERVLGTTASKIVNHIDRPVLVVRPTPSSDMRAAAARLKTDHARLEHVYSAMLAAYRHGDWLDVREQWSTFDATLRRHMDEEEADIFPKFRHAEPDAIAQLVAEHQALRQLLETLAVNIELHCVPERDMTELIRRLREHAAGEDIGVYSWMHAESAPVAPAA